MEGTKAKPVIASLLFYSSVDQIFTYGKMTFGEQTAIKYENLTYLPYQTIKKHQTINKSNYELARPSLFLQR